MPEQFGQVKDICEKQVRSVVFNLPDDNTSDLDLACDDVVNGTTFVEEPPNLIRHGISSEV